MRMLKLKKEPIETEDPSDDFHPPVSDDSTPDEIDIDDEVEIESEPIEEPEPDWDQPPETDDSVADHEDIDDEVELND